MTNTIESLGGRRFFITLGCGVATTALQWFGKLDMNGTTYSVVIIATVAAYITGNTSQKVFGKTPEKGTP